ncbi:hypothetical protein PUNSTDRAFT_118568 [Punctularia strigosozonata HHB-11173 SS5]|uniref:uncharacterized protein n=1 Tax=Punctularia strigosozonata (strain HHB-11173) TaxID=741275 RepID=UPI0004416A1D|nr:uncharacterized protein PUNSTDRAFT_118568 [Punctularia strigosozonata HHB-11173 SS5]EIN12911.1 hypothetical protein PUNSTDRAFT_118568 [Punctularia strigosozonata HHB-11173 SS5]
MSDLVYIKLIKKSCGLWPSFEPTRRVKLGDYGYIDQGSLVFQIEGNIFDEGCALKCGVQAPSAPGKAETTEVYKNDKTYINEVDSDGKAGVDGVAGASIKVKIWFKRGGAAALIIHNVRTTHIDRPARLRALRDDDGLRGKIIVTELKECESYFLAVSKEEEHDFLVEGGADVPIADVVGAEGGAKLGYRFAVRGGPGVTKYSARSDVFYPLFKLERIPSGFLPWNQNMKPFRGRSRLPTYESGSGFDDSDSDVSISDLEDDVYEDTIREIEG